MADLPESFRVSPQLIRISLKLYYLCPYDKRNGTLESCSKQYVSWYGLNRVIACTVLSDTRRLIRKHEITSTEIIMLYINIRIRKLSIGNAVF